MKLPYSDELNIGYLSRLFDDTTNCYKFFWFQAILKKVEKSRQLSFDDLITEMIIDAWYMVTEYHLRLGPLGITDNLQKVVEYIFDKAKDVPLSERKRQGTAETKSEFEELVERNNYKAIFSDYYKNYIMRDCNGPAEVIHGVPGRHGVAHGWYLENPSKKAALNAILLTDFIVKLDPIGQLTKKTEVAPSA